MVPELKSITVGGAIAGLGAESSSFKYGWVHETAEEIEVLLPEGAIVNCTPTNEHKDLFYAIPSSYGTLGYVLKAKVRLITVRSFVKISRLHFTDPEKFFEKLGELAILYRTMDRMTFIDGVNIDNEFYISLGEFVDHAPYVSDYKYMNIYYRSIPARDEDYLTTSDYIWRWDPDWFWCSKYFLMQNSFFRVLFGKFMLKSTVYWKIMHFANTNTIAKFLINRLGKKTETVIQDLQIPLNKAVEFYQFFKNEIKINPMYICPIQPNQQLNQFLFCDLQKDKWYVNFGAYGDFLPSHQEPAHFNRQIENKVRECNGNKWLYSNVFYSEEEFWQMYDKSAYLNLKKRYDPKGLLNDIYAKCVEKIV